MVHAARYPAYDLPRLDPARIFGYATAIAVHAVLLLLLLVPVTAPPSVATPEVFKPPIWIDAKREPPPPPPPVHARVVPPTHASPQPVRSQPQQPPVEQQQVIVDHGTEYVPETVTPSHPQPPERTGPLPGVQLEYASAPAPAYPRDALREGAQGTVLLKVLVDIDGRPLEVQVARSSGHRSLDRAAREQVLRRWAFRPAMLDGRAVQAIGLVPVDFRLD
jgi:protein TonB